MLFNIANGNVAIDADQYLPPFSVHTKQSPYLYSQTFVGPHTSTKYQQFSFFQHTFRDWNELPAHLVTMQTTSTFNASLCWCSLFFFFLTYVLPPIHQQSRQYWWSLITMMMKSIQHINNVICHKVSCSFSKQQQMVTWRINFFYTLW